MTPSPPERVTAPDVRDEVTGHNPRQGRLAGAVGADQRDLGAVADPEAHLVEKYSSVGQLVAHSRHIHMSHTRILASHPARRRVVIACASRGLRIWGGPSLLIGPGTGGPATVHSHSHSRCR